MRAFWYFAILAVQFDYTWEACYGFSVESEDFDADMSI